MFGHPQEMVRQPIIARRRRFFEKTAWQIEKAFVLAHSRRDQAVFPGSSAVEHSTVNRQVAGSNPARGAKFLQDTQGSLCFLTFGLLQVLNKVLAGALNVFEVRDQDRC